MNEAANTAKSLANGQAPQGNPYSDGQPPPHEYLWITGHYVIASQEKPGDWSPEMFTGNIKASITPTNGTSRMAMFSRSRRLRPRALKDRMRRGANAGWKLVVVGCGDGPVTGQCRLRSLTSRS